MNKHGNGITSGKPLFFQGVILFYVKGLLILRKNINFGMNTKLTLQFDQEVIEKAKSFAESHGISLSRLTEYLYRQITSGNYATLEDFPILDWVNQIAEGEAIYKRRVRKNGKDEFFESRK